MHASSTASAGVAASASASRHAHGGAAAVALQSCSPMRLPLHNLTNLLSPDRHNKIDATSKHSHAAHSPLCVATSARLLGASVHSHLPPLHLGAHAAPPAPAAAALATADTHIATSAQATAAPAPHAHNCTAACATERASKTFPDNSKYDGDVCVTSHKKHGRGTFVNRHGHTYTGSWVDDRRSGEGQYAWSSGDIYIGSWKNNNMDGHGLFKWTNSEQYLGQWKGGRMCGIGTKSMANGDSYTGMWKNDKSNGIGCKIFSCGDRHEGEYRDDRRNGHGAYYWSSGDKYEGNWVLGKMCGQGIKTMANGDKYAGSWHDDKANGFGVKTFAGGDRHEGEYSADLRHGHGVYYWTSGDRFEGVWQLGEQRGKGTYYYANGDVFKGKWSAGRKHGRGIFTSGNSSWLERWEDGVRAERTPCKFYPPRLLKTLRDGDGDGSKVMDAASEARAIRYEIDRLSMRLTNIQKGDQWQRHVRSSAFSSLVSRSTAALLSPQHAAPANDHTHSSAEYTNSVPSPAADIEAAAAAHARTKSDPVTAAAAAAANGTLSIGVDADHCMDPFLSIRPISPLTASPPASAALEGTIPTPHSAEAACRASTPTLAPVASSGGADGASPIPDDQLCKVCFTKEINTVLLPCAHVAVCMDCSTMLERCCICRADIDDAIQTFKA